MTKLKKILVLFAFCIISFMAVGCQSTFDYYTQSTPIGDVNKFVFSVDNKDLNDINSSSTIINKDNGEKETLFSYLQTVAHLFSINTTMTNNDNVSLMTFTYVSAPNSQNNKVIDKKLKKGFFLNKIEYTVVNPVFNFINEYNSPSDEKSLMGVLKNGYSDKQILPLTEAFPYLEHLDFSNFPISYHMKKEMGMKSDVPLVDGYYVYKTTFSPLEQNLTYTRYKANKIVWNSLVIVISVLLIVILIIIIKHMPKKEPELIPNNTHEYMLNRAYELEQAQKNIDVFDMGNEYEKPKDNDVLDENKTQDKNDEDYKKRK